MSTPKVCVCTCVRDYVRTKKNKKPKTPQIAHWLDEVEQRICLLKPHSKILPHPVVLCASVTLTGVEEDHGLQADVLLSLQLQLTEPRGGCQQHVENLHDALHTLSLLPKQTEREEVKKNKMEWSEQKDKKGERGSNENQDKLNMLKEISITLCVPFISTLVG